MGNWKQDETEASGWPRNIGLHAARRRVPSRPSSSQRLRREKDSPPFAIDFAPEQVESLTSDGRVVRQVLGDCVLVELQ